MSRKNLKDYLRSIEHILIVAISIPLLSILIYFYHNQAQSSAINIAEQNIKEYLRTLSAIRKNVSVNQKNELYRLQKEGFIDKEYFMPQLLSSTYNAREVNILYNRLRKDDNLPPISISFPSPNARNPLNSASKKEEKILEMFNRGEAKEYLEIIQKEDGPNLYYAIPSVKTTKECLRCHSNPDIAPKELIELYGDKRGFFEKEGEIRALIASTYPLAYELEVAQSAFNRITLITVAIFLTIYLLISFMLIKKRAHQDMLERLNSDLEKRVAERTENIAQTNRELKNQKALFETLINNAPIPIFYKDRSGIYLGINRAFESTFGFTKSEIVGKDVFDIASAENAKIHYLEDEKLYENPDTPQTYEYIVLNRKSGEKHDVIFYKSAYRDSEKNVVGIIGALLDITERKRLESELYKLNRSLEERADKEVAKNLQIAKEKRISEEKLIQQSRLAAMGEMIAAITHQWQQPLTAIDLTSRMLDDIDCTKEGAKESIQSAMQLILQQNEFMTETIKDFRDFFRPLKDKVYFKPCEACEEVKKLFHIQLLKNSTKFTIHEHQHFETIGFPNEFKQVLLNLVSNALYIFQKKRIKGKIDISFEIGEQIGIIRFRDNAGGIESSLLPDKLFEQNITTKGDEGSGIGLHLSKMIIETNMDGKIWAKNVADGAQFTIELPLISSKKQNELWTCKHLRG